MKVYIIGEYREQFSSRVPDSNFNPHPSYSNIEDILQACSEKNINCEYYGGVLDLIHDLDCKRKFEDDTLFLNISDGLTQPYCRVQAPVLLELLGVKYTGSTPFTVSLMNNKHYSKMALLNSNIENIKTPKGILVTKNIDTEYVQYLDSQYPKIVKPNNDGFSMGITNKSVVHALKDVIHQTSNLLADYDEVLIEDYVSGIDVSVFLLGNSGNIKINEIIAYKTYGKLYLDNEVRGIEVKSNKLSEKIAGNKILDKNVVNQLKNISSQIFSLFNARDIARIDYRITNNGKIYFIEINACPILSKKSDAKVVCESANISYSDLIQHYINIAYARY